MRRCLARQRGAGAAGGDGPEIRGLHAEHSRAPALMPKRASQMQEQADVLYRAASECHRQHTRYSKLVDRGASEDEQKAALEMAYLCDDALGTAIVGYETAAAKQSAPQEPWWHKGNMLWHASREYIRRHSSCDGMARRL